MLDSRDPELRINPQMGLDLLLDLDSRVQEYQEIKSKLDCIDQVCPSKDHFELLKRSVASRKQDLSNETPITQSQKLSLIQRFKQKEETDLAQELAKELKSEQQKTAAKQRWEKQISKLRVSQPDPRYYDSLPIKPGFFFFQSLILAPHSLLNTLKLNIPDTLYYGNKLWFLRTDKSGFVSCQDSVNCIDFLKLMEQNKCINPSHAFDYIAAVLRRRGPSETEMVKHLMDWTQFRSKMISRDIVEGCMLQKFVRSVGGKASVIRLHYHTSTRNQKANTAFFLSNVTAEHSSNFYKCVINLEAVNSFEVFRLRGSAITEVELYADALVKYIQRGYNVRLEEIELDFLKDEQGVLWFSGCRGFRLDPVSISRSLSPINLQGLTKEIAIQESEDRRKGRFVRCKLCRLHYQNQELPHLISVRMLVVYKMHASKRVELPLDTDHIKVVTADLLSQTVRICELCFMLVTTEFQLIEVEQRFADAMNIPEKEDGLEEDPMLAMQLQFLPKKMLQWRVLLHIRTIERHETMKNLEEFRLQINFHDFTTDFVVRSDADSEEIAVNKLKLFYLFSSPEKSIRHFLDESRVQIYIRNSSKTLASGEFKFLYNFPSSLPAGTALTQSRILSLFPTAGTSPFDLSLSIGFSCDRVCHSKYIKVGLTKVSDVYLPPVHYCNGDPLPVDWMEHFGTHNLDTSFKNEIAPEQFYQSTITREEMRRMESSSSGNLSHTLSRPRFRSRTPGLPPLSYRTTSEHRTSDRTKEMIPSLDLSGLVSNNDQTVKDLFSTVNSYLRDRPKSALSLSAQDRSQSISKTARTVTIEEIPSLTGKPHRPKRKQKGGVTTRENSSISTRMASPTPSLRSFREQYQVISQCVKEDLKAYEGMVDRRGRRIPAPQRSWGGSYDNSGDICN